MTIEELEGGLPNGFHDAHVRRVEVDLAHNSCVFELEVDFDDVDRIVRLFLTGLSLFILEPPDTNRFPLGVASTLVEGCPTSDSIMPGLKDYLRLAPDKSFFYSFYLNATNAFIHVAATDAQLEIGPTLPAEES